MDWYGIYKRKITNGWSEHLLVITSVEVVVGFKKKIFRCLSISSVWTLMSPNYKRRFQQILAFRNFGSCMFSTVFFWKNLCNVASQLCRTRVFRGSADQWGTSSLGDVGIGWFILAGSMFNWEYQKRSSDLNWPTNQVTIHSRIEKRKHWLAHGGLLVETLP